MTGPIIAILLAAILIGIWTVVLIASVQDWRHFHDERAARSVLLGFVLLASGAGGAPRGLAGRAAHVTALDLAPDFDYARSELAVLYALEGKTAEALAEVEKVAPDGDNRHTRPVVFARTGRREVAERLAGELEDLSSRAYVPPALLADVWASLGDRDKAFAALRRACRERDGAWGPYSNHPIYDELRSDPRFGEILECLNRR